MSIPEHEVNLEDVPRTDGRRASREAVHAFGARVDGHRFFGDDWGSKLAEMRRAFSETGELPWDIPTLHAWLALEIRGERFVDLDDVYTITDPDGSIRHTPDPGVPTRSRISHERMKNAIVERLRAPACARDRGLAPPPHHRTP